MDDDEFDYNIHQVLSGCGKFMVTTQRERTTLIFLYDIEIPDEHAYVLKRKISCCNNVLNTNIYIYGSCLSLSYHMMIMISSDPLELE